VAFSFFDPEQKLTALYAGPLALVGATEWRGPGSYDRNGEPRRTAGKLLPRPGTSSRSRLDWEPGTAQCAAGATGMVLALQGVPVLAYLDGVWRRRIESLANNPRLRRQRQVAQIIHDGLNDWPACFRQ